MTVGIVGLGLIGGSFAKAYHEAGATVLAWNRSRSVLDFAIMSGAVDAELTEDNIAACDLVLIALYPEATIEWFRRMAPHIGAHPVVLDCGGTKRTICAACFPIAKEHGVTFLGRHPMAGTQYSGFKNAKATMYHGAPMVIVPPDFDDVLLFDHVKQLLQPAGFARFSFTTAEAPVEIEETSVSADALTVIFDQETRIELNMQLENYYPGRSLDLGQGITINLKVRKKGGLIFNV